MTIKQNGLTMRQITLISTFFRYYDYDALLNQKFQLVDVMNGILSKDKRELNWKNIYSNSLLSTLFENVDDVIVDESHTLIKLISDTLYTNDFNKKQTTFNIIRKKTNVLFESKSNPFYQFIQFISFSFEDFFADPNIINSVLTNKDDKIILIHLLLNIYKILLVFPHHVKIHNTKDSIAAIRTKMIGQSLVNKEIDYLKGDYDEDRISDYTCDDDVMVYIASIDSYYFIYKKYNIKEKSLYMIFDVYDYIETLIPTKKYPDPIKRYLSELCNTLNIICQKSFNIDIKTMF